MGIEKIGCLWYTVTEVNMMRLPKGLMMLFSVSLLLLGLTACQNEKSNSATYEQITAQEAKAIMDAQTDYIIIDARTQEEFEQGHIKGAVLIPEYEIAAKAEKALPNKDSLILVYCRSGRRSKIASQELVKLGYTNVKEFGGIIDWPYETVR